jgi:phospholipid transport system substrate-binding protein
MKTKTQSAAKAMPLLKSRLIQSVRAFLGDILVVIDPPWDTGARGAVIGGGLAGLSCKSCAVSRPECARKGCAFHPLGGRTVDRVFVILRDSELAKDAKRRLQRLRETVDEVFDWVTMATSSLGHYRSKLSDAERREFVSVFKELLAQRYMKDIDRFQGSERVLVRGSTRVEDVITVKTLLITSSGEQVPMDYMLRSTGPELRVIDFAIEGVSLVNHYRTTFARFLVNRPFGELLAQLKSKLGMS